MNREVEERIVAMYFDNEDFEKNAKSTIKTLGQLKEGLNLEEASKGFNVFEKLGKTLNFEKANASLNKMKLNLSSINTKFKNAFKIGAEPLREAEGFMKQLNGYVTKYIGFDVAGKIVHGIENAVRNLTVAPVTAGWRQYESTMDSIKTIISSTGESIDTVKARLAEMTEYANKTIYSLTDMTSNLGKFTNNGVELDRAVKAMEGIANATADAGQGAQQASMAMYNVSQAIGVGKMTTIDWKSLENANIATQKLKKTFLEMAALQGRIEKKTDGRGMVTYMLTHDDDGKKLKESIELTTANFREYLSKGWLDKETMLRAFEVYSGAVNEATLESWGVHEEDAKKYFMSLGQEALEAATQVRTFSKMMDALKESAQSGWARTFELIFGDMNQGTTLWTTINNILDEILSKSAEARNNIFEIWSGKEIDTSENEQKLSETEELLKNAQERLEALMQTGTSEGIDKTIQKDLQDIQKLKDEIEQLRSGDRWDKDSLIATREKKVAEIEKGIEALRKKQAELEKAEAKRAEKKNEKQKYLDQIDEYDAELADLKKQQGRNRDSDGNVADKKKEEQLKKAIDKKQKQIGDVQKKIRQLDATSGDTEIEKIQKEIAEYEKQIDKLNREIDRAKNTPKSSIVDEKGRTGREILIDALLGTADENGERVGGSVNLLKEIGSTISGAFKEVFGSLDAEGLFKFSQRIEQGIKHISDWFGKVNDEGSRLNKLQKILKGFLGVVKAVLKILKAGWNLVKKLASPVIDFVIDALSGVYGFFVKMGEMNPGELLSHIGDGLRSVWEKIKSLFAYKEILDENGKGTGQYELPIVTWLKNIWNMFKATVKTWATDNGLEGVWNTMTGWWNTLVQIFEAGKSKVSEAYETVRKWWNDHKISEFFQGLWQGIASPFTKKLDFVTYDGAGRHEHYKDAPIIEFFNNIWSGVSEAFEGVKAFWEKDELGIKSFFQGVWDSIANIFTPLKDDSGEIVGNAPIVTFFSTIWDGVEEAFNSAKEWWEKDELGIRSFFQEIWDAVSGIFAPEKNDAGEVTGNAPIVAFFTNIWNGVEEAFNAAKAWWENDELGIRKFFKTVWKEMADVFKPQLDFVTYDGKKGRQEHYKDMPVVAFLKNLWTSIQSVWNSISKWEGWEAIGEFLGNFWDWLKTKATDVYNWFFMKEDGTKTGFAKFIGDVKQAIATAWEALVGWEGWETVGKFLGNFWDWLKTKATDAYNWFFMKEDGTKTGFAKFLSDVKATIVDAWEGLAGWEGWDSIGKFLEDTWAWVMDMISPDGEASKSADKAGRSKYGERARAAIQTVGEVFLVSDVGSGSKAEKKAEKTEERVSLFQRVINALTGFFTSIADAAKEIAGNPVLNDFLSALGDFFKMLVQMLTEALKLVTRVGTGQGTGTDIVGVISLGLGYIVTKIYEFMHTKHLSEITSSSQSFGLQFLEIAAGIALISAAIIAISNVDTSKLMLASGVVLVIGGVIATIIGVLTKLTKQGTANKVANALTKTRETGLERLGKSLLDNLSKVAIVFVALKELPALVQTIGDVKKELGDVDIGDDIMKTLMGVAALISGISLVFALISKIGGVNIAVGYQTASAILIFFGEMLLGFVGTGGLISLIEMIPGVDDESISKWAVEKITVLATIINAIGGALGGFIEGLIHGGTADVRAKRAADATETTLNAMTEMADVFDTEKTSGILRIMKLVQTLSDGTLNIDPNKLANFGQSMQHLAGGLYNVAYYLNNEKLGDLFGKIWDGSDEKLINNVNGFEAFAKRLGEMFSSFAPFVETSSYKVNGFSGLINQIVELSEDSNLDKLSSSLAKIMQKLSTDLPDEGIQFDGLTIAKNLFDQIQVGLNDPKLPKFNAVPVVDAIVLALLEGDTAIAAIVHQMVQAGLDKSGTGANGEGYKIDNETTSQLLSLLGQNEGSITSILENTENEMMGEDGKGGFIETLGSFEDKVNGILGKDGSLNLDFSGLSDALLGDGENSITGIFNEFKENLKGFGIIGEDGSIQLNAADIGKQIIGEEGIENIQSIIRKVNGLISEDGSLNFSKIREQLFGKEGTGGLIEIFKEFKNQLVEILKDTEINGVISFVNKLNGMFMEDGKFNLNLDLISEQLMGSDGKGGVIGVFKEFVGKLREAIGEDTVSAIEGAFIKLNSILDENGRLKFDLSGIEEQLFDEEGNPTGLLQKLSEVMVELQEVISTMEPLELHITPVFDYQNLTPEEIMAQLGLPSTGIPIGVNTGEMQISFTGLRQELGMDEVLSELRQIYSAVGAGSLYQAQRIDLLAGHMDGIADEVSRLKLWLDGKALVGGIIDEIDAQLYNKAIMFNRP